MHRFWDIRLQKCRDLEKRVDFHVFGNTLYINYLTPIRSILYSACRTHCTAAQGLSLAPDSLSERGFECAAWYVWSNTSRTARRITTTCLWNCALPIWSFDYRSILLYRPLIQKNAAIVSVADFYTIDRDFYDLRVLQLGLSYGSCSKYRATRKQRATRTRRCPYS